MAIIRPFKAIRPTRDKVSLVASRSYLSYKKDTLIEKLENNPYTFLHVIHPDYSNNKLEMKGTNKYPLIKDKFSDFQKEGVFIEEKQESLYIYQQEKSNSIFTGFICASSIDEYLNRKIKIHEQTISKKEKMFKDYLDITRISAEPVLLTYHDQIDLDQLLNYYVKKRPEYEFTTTNGVTHKLWVIKDKDDIHEIQEAFKKVETLYIADGHHRSASSALLCQQRRKSKTHYTGNENFNFFMSYIIPEKQLKIHDFNRLITDLNGLSPKEFLSEINKNYEVQIADKNYKPNKDYEIGMYLEGKWYVLRVKKLIVHDLDEVEKLDVSILSKNILSPILGIHNLRSNKRVQFLEGSLGKKALSDSVDSGKFAAAFLLKPIKIEQLKAVANAKKTMPPKSTYIEPKLRSGLLIYNLE